jgi:sporulation protein YlmC with PRC-barrel domain
MRLRYHQIAGKQVVSSDGRKVGVISDLVAERRDDALRVTALKIGPLGLVRRIGFRRAGAIALRPQEIPWRLVASIDGRVHLSVDSTALAKLPAAAIVDTSGQEPPT